MPGKQKAMMIVAPMRSQAFVVKERATAIRTLNVQVPWYVAKTTAPGITEMTAVCSHSQVCVCFSDFK